MKWAIRPRDTIAWRFGGTIAASMLLAFLLIGLFFVIGGTWARPPIDAMARLDGATALVRVMEAAPTASRPALAEAVRNNTYRASWYEPGSSTAEWLDKIAKNEERNPTHLSDEIGDFQSTVERQVVVFSPGDPVTAAPDFPLRSPKYPNAYFMAVKLADGGWLVFTGFARDWGLSQSQRLVIWIAFIVVSFVAVSAIATRQLARPIKQFAQAVRRTGTTPHSSPIVESGPRELREVIAAFNDMRGQIEEFVGYRTAMLAAISHDLRTPLTRMRLRGEFIQDKTQQARLFRDVDEMRAMIDGALSFFSGAGTDEETRTFDLPGILQSISDDFADQNVDIDYTGPNHLTYVGRPLALKRAFTNLIENAVKYGTPPQVSLNHASTVIRVTIRDRGPGIPDDAMDKVFKPFYRVDKSRNRSTGGVGLGLTAAQAIVRGHGGDIVLRNHPAGGLEAEVFLPVSETDFEKAQLPSR